VLLPHAVNNAHSATSQALVGILFTVTFEFDLTFIKRPSYGFFAEFPLRLGLVAGSIPKVLRDRHKNPDPHLARCNRAQLEKRRTGRIIPWDVPALK